MKKNPPDAFERVFAKIVPPKIGKPKTDNASASKRRVPS